MAVSAVLVCVGSLGPWETVLGETLYGFDRLGLFTLVAGLAALVLLVVDARATARPRPGWPVVLALAAGVVAAGAGSYDWWDTERLDDDIDGLEELLGENPVAVSWGLVLVTLSGISLILAATVDLLRRASEGEQLPAQVAEAIRVGAIVPPDGAPVPIDTQRGVDPVTAAQLAGYGRRLASGIVDLLVIVTVWAITFGWAITTEDPATEEISDAAAIVFLVVFVCATPLYQWLMIGTWGRTLGKMALATKVVRSEDALRVSYRRALGRAASFELLGVFTLPLFLAFLWPLWDDRRQTLYDKMANTIVIRSGGN